MKSLYVRGWIVFANSLIAMMQTPYAKVHRLLFWHGRDLSNDRWNPEAGVAAGGVGPLAERLDSMTPLSGSFPASNDGLPIVFACCDTGYLVKFGAVLARSLAATTAGPRLHLHVMADVSDDIDRTLAEIDAAFGQSALSVTVERRDFKAWSQNDRILYYRSTRILRLCELMERTGQALVMIDADNIFLTSLEGIVASVSGCDVALPLRMWRREPWMRVMAGFVYISDSPRGKKFLRAVSAAVSEGLRCQEKDGYFDQYHLYRALSVVPGLDYRSFPAQVAMVRNIEHGWVLSGRGGWKDRHWKVVEELFGPMPLPEDKMQEEVNG